MKTLLTPLHFIPKSLVVCFAAAGFLVCAVSAEARVPRIVIEQRQSPAYEGKSFGGVGQYEILSGKAYGELDPKDPHNTIITDLQFAPRNSRGMVEYAATFTLVKPVDLAKANGVLLYAVPNRGNRITPSAIGVAGGTRGKVFFERRDIILPSRGEGGPPHRPPGPKIPPPDPQKTDGSSTPVPGAARL